jgi:hypothetical protein
MLNTKPMCKYQSDATNINREMPQCKVQREEEKVITCHCSIGKKPMHWCHPSTENGLTELHTNYKLDFRISLIEYTVVSTRL